MPQSQITERRAGTPVAVEEFVRAGQGPGLPSTRAAVREWVVAAQPNAMLAYGRGHCTSEAAPYVVRAYVMELYAKGLVSPLYKKGADGAPGTWLVQRTQRPVLKGMVL